MGRRSRVTVGAALAFGVAFLVWTLLLPTFVDDLWPHSPVSDRSVAGQIAAAVALVTAPIVVYPLLLVLAWWAARRRFRAMARAIAIAVVLAVTGTALLKITVGRDRPASPWDYLVSSDPMSYPSAHTVGATVAAMLVAVLATTTRRPRRVRVAAHVLGAAAVAVVAADRLLLGAHFVTDVVGGVLFGGLVASAACVLGDVHMLPAAPARTGPGRLVVIYNPTKVRDLALLHRFVGHDAEARGWAPPIWLATSEHDPGGGMARAALESAADLVLVVGGDGTVREVCAGMEGSRVPMAILPSGTGNLLARNLGVPLDAGSALGVAFTGAAEDMDLLRYADLDGGVEGIAAVMVGLGADAAVLHDTDEALKRSLGPAAYVWAGIGHIRARPVALRLTVDGRVPLERDASLVEVGNVGDLYPGVSLMPAASAHDGTLEVLVASPQTAGDVARMIGGVLRRSTDEPLLDRVEGRSVVAEFAEPVLCQVDGDVVGRVQRIRFEVVPAAVRVVLPSTPES
ncbi:diacylglycerol kinase family protein [Tessaracoccus sp. Z1128]